jgi:hypothetical protein
MDANAASLGDMNEYGTTNGKIERLKAEQGDVRCACLLVAALCACLRIAIGSVCLVAGLKPDRCAHLSCGHVSNPLATT